jgi:hypothetical protein
MWLTSRCHWPQGTLARENPRLVNALGLGWSDAGTLGRLGAWHGTPIGEGGFTDDEVTALGTLVNVLALRQLILVGPLTPVWEEVLTFIWRQESSPDDALRNHPRLIVVGPANTWTAGSEFLARCAFIPGDPSDPETVRAIRAMLAPGINAGLVVSGELAAPILSGLLNGLAPFLGHDGAVLAACGRYDRNTILETLPAARNVNAWIEKNGRELGFAHWQGPAGLRAQLGNWIVFRRALTQVVWNNQWTFTAADLALAGETEDLLVKP